MDILFKLIIKVKVAEGGKEQFTLVKKIENATFIPQINSQILDEICGQELRVKDVIYDYDDNTAYVNLKDVSISTKAEVDAMSERINKNTDKDIDSKKWLYIEG